MSACRSAVRSANEHFLNVYDIQQMDILSMQSLSQATARTAVTKLYQEVDGKIDQFCDSAWERFAAGKPAMNYKQFVEMTQEFPQISQNIS